LACLSATVDEAVAQRDSWLERLRAGLVAFLGFFDDRPELGRLLLLEHPKHDGTLALRCEQRVLGVLTGLLDDGSPLAAGELMPEPQLVSELVAGGVVAVVRKRMITEPGERLVELAPELMAFVVAPYLGQSAAQGELAGISLPPSAARNISLGGMGFQACAGAETEVSGPAASAHLAGARKPRRMGAYRRTVSRSLLLGRTRVRRPIVNREDKGVVDK
jgi:hypothetical protein